MQNLSYEKKVDLYENEPVDGTHFHTCMNGFACRLVLTQAKGNLEMTYCKCYKKWKWTENSREINREIFFIVGKGSDLSYRDTTAKLLVGIFGSGFLL